MNTLTAVVAAVPVGYTVSPGDVLAKLARPGPSCRGLSGLCGLFPDRGGVGVRAESVMRGVSTLEGAGLAEVWEVEGKEPSVVLTALGAERAGLELDGSGRRWRAAGGDSDRAVKLRARRQTVSVDLEKIEDPSSPDPKLWEWQGDGLPLPTIILGERVQWQGPRWTKKRPCAGCAGERRGDGKYCLVCDLRKG